MQRFIISASLNQQIKNKIHYESDRKTKPCIPDVTRDCV